MNWKVLFHDEFLIEFNQLSMKVQDELIAQAKLLQRFGPSLSRPKVDTLNGSKFINMKELRFNLRGGVWRVAFAFDKEREAILLVAGNKMGISKKRFYQKLISIADKRFTEHLAAKKLEA